MPLLLDTIPSARAAYSTRRLRSGYSGPCLRVIRSADSVEADIGFDANGNLDETALASSAGAAAKVMTWYDQSGNGYDLTQSTDSVRPGIVSASVIIRGHGASVALSFGNQYMTNASAGPALPWSVSAVSTITSRIAYSARALMGIGYSPAGNAACGIGCLNPLVYDADISGYRFGPFVRYGGQGSYDTARTVRPIVSVFGATHASNSAICYCDGESVASNSSLGNHSGSTLIVGTKLSTSGTPLTDGNLWQGRVSEVCVWASVLTGTQMVTVQTNQAQWFQIGGSAVGGFSLSSLINLGG